MVEKIKEIMHASFYNSFYVDKKSKENNRLYINCLVDKLLIDIDGIQNMKYEDIAEYICILDKRIKNIFEIDYGRLGRVFLKFDWGDIYARNSFDVLNNKLIDELLSVVESYDEFIKIYTGVSVFVNWDKLSVFDRDRVTEEICLYVEGIAGIKVGSSSMYRAKVFCEDFRLSIIINELVNWLCDKKSVLFVYQTEDAVNMLRDFEIYNVYHQIYEELSSHAMSEMDETTGANLISSITNIKLVKCVEREKYNYLYSELTKSEECLLDSIISMRKRYADIVYCICTKNAKLKREKYRCEQENNDRKVCLEKNEKKLSNIIRENNELRKENVELKRLYREKNRAMNSELYSLRNYMFSMYRDNNVDTACDKGKTYNGRYDEVAIVGGHSRWHSKLVEALPGVNIVNTDQNVVDWTFFDRMKVIVFVTNYIRHSMYYRAIERIAGQEILYVNYKNVEQLRNAVNVKLLNNS